MLKQAFGAIALTAGVLAASGAEIVVKQPDYSFEIDKGQAVIRDGAGKRMLQLGDLRIGWGNPQKGSGVSAEKIGEDTVKVIYQTENDPENLVTFGAVYTVKPEGVRASYSLTAPGTMNVGGAQLTLRPVDGAKKGDLYKAGLWTRHDKGGVPSEVRDGYFRCFGNAENNLWMQVTGNHGWNDYTSQHLNFRPKEKGDKERFAETFFFVLPGKLSGEAAAAYCKVRPLALELTTAKNYNWFETGEEPAQLTLKVSNVSREMLNGEKARITVRDFDGGAVLKKEIELETGAGGVDEFTFELPAGERNLFFAEASVMVGGREYFTRTNVAVLPPFEFKHRSEGIFGIAAFFKLPNEAEAFRLMQRLGVYQLREYDNRIAKRYGMEALYHKNVKVDIGPEEWIKMRDKFLREIKLQENPGFEFGNEWNMNKTREESDRRGKIYANLCKDLKAARDAAGLEFKIISQGMVNQYPGFARDIYNHGGWNSLDAVAWHTGRGNVTPDYTKGYWNFLGSLRTLKKMMTEFGEKPIYLSEAYGKTMPNDWWYDSYRQAAENLILSYALGFGEGVAMIHWYQLNDSVWSDHGGVNHKDGEYHYGLLMRDNSFKPSAMAYAAAAEALDGAKFLRYHEGEGEVKGILFDTPKGKLSILYDRIDGYYLSPEKKVKDYAHTEPWVRSWKTRTRHSFKASGETVTVVDVIGRSRELPVRNGEVVLELDGAPLMVFGLDFQ